MKIVEHFKNIINKIRKKNWKLKEEKKEYTETVTRNWIQKVDISKTRTQITREHILKELRKYIIVEDLSEELNYNTFSEKITNLKFNKKVLLENDITALECLYEAIKYGNKETYPNIKNNKINMFLKENPNNIIIAINLMIQDAENLYKSLDESTAKRTNINSLIPETYDEICKLLEDYKEQEQSQNVEEL